MQLHYLLVIVVSDVSVTVAVIMSTRVVNNCDIRTELRFLNRTEPNSFRTESEYFKNRTKIKNLFRTSLLIML